MRVKIQNFSQSDPEYLDFMIDGNDIQEFIEKIVPSLEPEGISQTVIKLLNKMTDKELLDVLAARLKTRPGNEAPNE